MLMPSQSPPSSTTTIQTLPSDQQQQKKKQDEYVDTLNRQKNNTTNRLRREKSMEFDDNVRFNDHINDDINNNYSTSEQLDDLNGSDSNDSLANSSADEEPPLTISMPLSTPLPINSKIPNPIQDLSSNRRQIRPIINRRLFGDIDHKSSTISEESDPNVFLISSDTNSHNTIRKTKHDVKRFACYIKENFNESRPLHTLPADVLCQHLKHYFENTKKFDGTEYEPDTLRSFLLSIERFLKSKEYEHNLMESPLFQSCRQVIFHKREQWKKQAGASNNHHHHSGKNSMISLNVKSITHFDRSRADGLLLEIYAHISRLFNYKPFAAAQLVWSDIVLIDEQYLMRDHSRADEHMIKLSALPDNKSKCPIQAYRLYATHRPQQSNNPQSPFFLMPRTTTATHTWYKTTAAGKHLEQVLQNAIKPIQLPKQASNPLLTIPLLNGKRNESRLSSPNYLPYAKRIHKSNVKVEPLNLSVSLANPIHEDDSGTASSSPCNSLSNEMNYPSAVQKSSPPLNDVFQKSFASSVSTPFWDESVTEILLTVAKQRESRLAKINSLRSYLEEKLGVVEFLCLYRGFKSEPKLTFDGTPWEHYQRFLPVLFTLLALDNINV